MCPLSASTFWKSDLWLFFPWGAVENQAGNGVCGRELGCDGAASARQSLTALSQPTLNLALTEIEQNSSTQLLVCSLSYIFLFY